LPVILRLTGELEALLKTVIVFVNWPGIRVLYFTLIVPVLPGSIGSFVHSGTVHPQEELTFDRTSGSFPVFLKTKL
jgi:hypothetical protein